MNNWIILGTFIVMGAITITQLILIWYLVKANMARSLKELNKKNQSFGIVEKPEA